MALGVVLTPYGHNPGFPPAAITHAYAGATTWEPPFDPQWYTRGEAGYYYDTQLGGGLSKLKRKLGLGNIPTDFQQGVRLQYTPVSNGWVPTVQGYQSGGWQPPYGRWPGYPSAYGPPLAGLGDLPGTAPTVAEVMAEMQAQNDRMFSLALVSTAAVAVSGLIGLFRTLKLIKEDK